MSRLILASFQTMLRTLQQKPALMEISAIAHLKPIVEALSKPTKGCKCTQGNQWNRFRPQFESTFNLLAGADLQKFKEVAGVTEICFYSKGSNGTELKCK